MAIIALAKKLPTSATLVRADGAPPPPYGQPDRKMFVFDAFFREAVKNYFAFFGKMIFR